jgi:SAM-dependent methyltransferase
MIFMPFSDYVWHPIRATHKAWRLLHNMFWDLRFGGSCGGTKRSPFKARGAVETSSTEYGQLHCLFRRVAIGPSDVLVDVGCGKGRVLNYWLSLGLTNRLIGIELDPEIATLARKRLKAYPNVTILTGDALDLLPADATVLFLFNPFHAEVVARLKTVLMQRHAGRDLTIIYYNSVALDVFRNDPDIDLREMDAKDGLFYPSAILRMQASAFSERNCLPC